MRAKVFAVRCMKEILRDPLSYIFCIGFPVVMLFAMTGINSIIPPEANMTIFRIDNLTPGVAVFGLSFTMLFATLTVSKDRSGALLSRLFTSPMKASDFIVGYTIPMFIIALIQFVVTFGCGAVISLFTDVRMNILDVLLSCVTMLPCALLFIGFGILFGTLFNEKGAPPLCSIIISLSSIVGGIWFDIETIPEGNVMKTICEILPFCHSVRAARAAVAGNYNKIAIPLLISLAWAVVIYAVSVLSFGIKMKSEKK